MNLRYKCKVCKLDTTVVVPDRRRQVDTRYWLDVAKRKAALDHKAKKLACPNTELDLLIPVEEQGQEPTDERPS